jgi:hypothetical protein
MRAWMDSYPLQYEIEFYSEPTRSNQRVGIHQAQIIDRNLSGNQTSRCGPRGGIEETSRFANQHGDQGTQIEKN